MVRVCILIGFALLGSFAKCVFKSFRRGAADAAAGSWKSAAPLGARAEGFGELVRGFGGFYKIS